MRGHFDMFTGVDSLVNACISDFSVLMNGKSLFGLFVNYFSPCFRTVYIGAKAHLVV